MLQLHTREIRICPVAMENPNQSYSKDKAKVHLETTHCLIKTWINTVARVQAKSIVCGKSKTELLQGELKLVLLLVWSEISAVTSMVRKLVQLLVWSEN
jgi:hypothetical protein